MTPTKLLDDVEVYASGDLKGTSEALTTQDLDDYVSCRARFSRSRQDDSDPFFVVLDLLVRRGLSVFYAEPVAARTPKLMKRIARALWDCAQDEDDEDGIAPSALINEFVAFADDATKEDLDDLYREFRKSLLGSIALDEEPYVITRDRPVTLEFSGVRVSGTIDRVDVEGGKAVIIHYGTDTDYEVSDFRLALDALLYDEVTHDDDFALKVVAVRYQNLSSRKEREIEVTEGLLDDTYDKAQKAVRGIVELLEKDTARPRKGTVHGLS